MASLLSFLKHLSQKPDSQSKQSYTKPPSRQTRHNSVDSRGHKTEARDGVEVPIKYLFWLARPPRLRTAALAAIIHFHSLAPGGSGPFSDGEVNSRHSHDFWFVKVVCTLFVRSHSCLDTYEDYLSKNLTPSVSFEVVKRLNDPKLGLRFLEFSRVNLSLIHSFKTYNLLIRSLCETGLHGSAKVVFDYMRSDGHLPNSSLIEFLALSFTKAGNFDVVKGLLSQLQAEEVTVGIFTYNNLLNLLVKMNRVDEAVCMFKELVALYSRPDSSTFNILIRGLCKIGEVDKAFEFFHGMESFGCYPDVITYNTLINGMCRVNEVDRGYKLLKEVQISGLLPDVVTYTSVISGYCKLGKMGEASNLYNEMTSSGIQPSAVTFNVLIDGFGKAGDMVSSESMCKKMLSCGWPPDVVTFTSLIDGYCRNGQVNQGLKLWDKMNARNLSPNVYTFAVLINALCKENRLNEARQFLRELKRRDIIPKSFIYNPVIDGYCKAGNLDEANAIVAEMEEKRCKPDKMTFTILIIGHCVKGRMFEAISIFEKMLKICCAPDNFTVNSLISCLLKSGMPNEAFRIKQIASEDLKLGFPSLKKAIPTSTSTEIPVAA